MKNKPYRLMMKNVYIYASIIDDKKEAEDLGCKVGDLIIQPYDIFSHQVDLPEFILDKYIADEFFELIEIEELCLTKKKSINTY